jgi:hypothetical protein
MRPAPANRLGTLDSKAGPGKGIKMITIISHALLIVATMAALVVLWQIITNLWS